MAQDAGGEGVGKGNIIGFSRLSYTGKPLIYDGPGPAAGPRTQYKSIYVWRWAPHIFFFVKAPMYTFGFGPGDVRSEVV